MSRLHTCGSKAGFPDTTKIDETITIANERRCLFRDVHFTLFPPRKTHRNDEILKTGAEKLLY
ncbi:hypothetical protein E2C01_024752 [Portunus trituberculatus]|uniref:Uncharacterized protein n=1 Tax=Portunus trituberculatus TaxID=210409 RepID=A0A5B7EBD6_PORTR|nr:hypothetical protein [Portunus trituberculatus]